MLILWPKCRKTHLYLQVKNFKFSGGACHRNPSLARSLGMSYPLSFLVKSLLKPPPDYSKYSSPQRRPLKFSPCILELVKTLNRTDAWVYFIYTNSKISSIKHILSRGWFVIACSQLHAIHIDDQSMTSMINQ